MHVKPRQSWWTNMCGSSTNKETENRIRLRNEVRIYSVFVLKIFLLLASPVNKVQPFFCCCMFQRGCLKLVRQVHCVSKVESLYSFGKCCFLVVGFLAVLVIFCNLFIVFSQYFQNWGACQLSSLCNIKDIENTPKNL